jgi:hypothetical protein
MTEEPTTPFWVRFKPGDGWEIMRGPSLVIREEFKSDADDLCKLLNDAWYDGYMCRELKP